MPASQASPSEIASEPVVRIGPAVAAWIIPGLGHILAGERTRGLLIMAAMGFLIFGGLLIGGIDVVDRKNDRLWFLAQAGCGPVVFGIDALRQNVSPAQSMDFSPGSADRSAFVNGDPATQTALRRAGLSHVNEAGTLYIALAGLMNVVVILDLLHHVPRTEPDRRRASAPGASQ